MTCRLYFLFPDTVYTKQAVRELKSMGVKEDNMRTVANRRIDLSGLPVGKQMQSENKGSFFEELFWMVNLTMFFAALALLLSDLYWGVTVSTIVPMVVITVCAFFGVKMTGLPGVQLEDFKPAIKRGEVLLMIDAAEEQIIDIENEIQRTHPEVIIGGIGWTIEPIKL